MSLHIPLKSIQSKPICLTITEEPSGTNIYPDSKLKKNKWKYYEDYDKQNKDKIQRGAHLHYRKETNTPYTFIGIIEKVEFSGTRTLIKDGKEIQCDCYILTIHLTKKSKGLRLCPNTIVPRIKEEHPSCIRVKKDGSPRKAINGAMKFQYDACSNSGIKQLNTSPQRGILY